MPGPGLTVAWTRRARGTDPAEALLRWAVAARLGREPDGLVSTRHCPRCGSTAHGRPGLRAAVTGPVPHVSLSRAAGVVAVAVSTQGPVGVDVETVEPAPGVSAVLLADGEEAVDALAVATTWVRKEALLKATGHGLSVDLRDIRVSAPDRRPALLDWRAPGRPGTPVWMSDVGLGPGLVGCVAQLGGAPQEVSLVEVGRAALVGKARRRTAG
ncbi:MAG: 4'-phosphopantetheinyl transferase family protein [Nocardioidaceae bacterium]